MLLPLIVKHGNGFADDAQQFLVHILPLWFHYKAYLVDLSSVLSVDAGVLGTEGGSLH
jgi:hypothetical protein